MSRKRARRLSYRDIKIGRKFGFQRLITKDDLFKFAQLSGDYSPLHTQEGYGRKTEFKGIIVHGLLLSSLFSALLGMYCPGENNLCLAQSINFLKPLKPGSKVRVEGEVLRKIDSVRIAVIRTRILCGKDVIVDGEAKVKIRSD